MGETNTLPEILSEFIATEPALEKKLQPFLDQNQAVGGNISTGNISNSMGITVGNGNLILQDFQNNFGFLLGGVMFFHDRNLHLKPAHFFVQNQFTTSQKFRYLPDARRLFAAQPDRAFALISRL